MIKISFDGNELELAKALESYLDKRKYKAFEISVDVGKQKMYFSKTSEGIKMVRVE